MKRFHFNIVVGEKEVGQAVDSNSKATAITMAMNRLSKEEQEQVTTIEIYAEQELSV